jgi:quinol monooxygenase YgiN
MYMRVVRGRIDPAKIDETVSQLGQDLAAAVRRMPGCQSFVGGGERATGQTITVSTWDTEEHARYSQNALGDVASRIQALGVQVNPPEIFEVTTSA